MRYKIPIEILELESDNYHMLIKADFGNGRTGNWIIDTGASKSVFDKNLNELYLNTANEPEEIHSAGISEKPLQTSIAILKPFRIGNFKLNGLKVALLDLSHINRLYGKSTDMTICGLLGGDFLMKSKAVIDYHKSLLKIQV